MSSMVLDVSLQQGKVYCSLETTLVDHDGTDAEIKYETFAVPL